MPESTFCSTKTQRHIFIRPGVQIRYRPRRATQRTEWRLDQNHDRAKGKGPLVEGWLSWLERRERKCQYIGDGLATWPTRSAAITTKIELVLSPISGAQNLEYL